jgi:hypothetical protein
VSKVLLVLGIVGAALMAALVLDAFAAHELEAYA